MSEQENEGLEALLLERCTGGATHQARSRPAQPFRFVPPRALIDWQALNAVHLGDVVRNTDVDALESVLDVVAYGDIEAEDYRTLTPANFVQLFRTAQLTVNYLLHVQDRLADDSSTAKGELARVQQRLQLVSLKAKELKEELAGSRKEARHLKKTMRTFEALALARQPTPAPQQQPQVVERLVEVPDAAAVKRLEAQVAELERERTELHRANKDLAAALEAAQAASDARATRAADSARQEEQAAAQCQLHAALEAARQKQQYNSKPPPTVSVVVSSSEDTPELRACLAAALRQEREAQRRADEAEAEAAAAVAAAGRALASPTAEMKRLRARLEAAAAEADVLRSQLAAAAREQSPQRVVGAAARPMHGYGLAAELEDADETLVQDLEAKVRELRAKLSAAEASRASLAQCCKTLEDQLQQAEQQVRDAAEERAASAAAADAQVETEVLSREVERLKGEKAALREECRHLRQQAAQDAVEVEHLTQRLQQLTGGRIASSSPKAAQRAAPGTRSPAGSQRTGLPLGDDQAGLHEGAPPSPEHDAGAADPAPKGGIGSPIEEGSAEDAPVAASVGQQSPAGPPTERPGSRPGSARRRHKGEGSPRPGSACGTPRAGTHAAPSAAEQRQFRRELGHALHNAERPGVVSRFPHSLGSFLALRPDLEAELEEELAEELHNLGFSPGAERLTDEELREACARLEQRRGEARAAMSPGDRQRYDCMRRTVVWHVQRMAELASGQREASPMPLPLLAQPPSGLRPIRTASKDAELASPRHRGFVEQVLDDVGDEAAVYSPLARGASVLSEQGYLHALEGDATPRSLGSSPGPFASSEGRTQHRPWSTIRGGAASPAPGAERPRSPQGRSAPALLHRRAEGIPTGGAGWPSSAASSPSKATRSVHFVEKPAAGNWDDAASQAAGGPAAAQRMGRRPVVSSPPAAGTARRLWKEG